MTPEMGVSVNDASETEESKEVQGNESGSLELIEKKYLGRGALRYCGSKGTNRWELVGGRWKGGVWLGQ